jgi:Glycosyltransferase family 87
MISGIGGPLRVDCTFVSNCANRELADLPRSQDSHISRKFVWQSPCVFPSLPSIARLPQFFRLNAEKALIIGVTTAILQIYGAFRFGIAAESDFGIFQGSTARFLDGGRMYSPESFDFTPPAFHALLFPLAHLDPGLGYVLWTALNVAIACVVFHMVLRAVPGAWTQRNLIAACVINAAGVQMTLRLGQVSWMVALPVTCAWIAARSSRPFAAGAWTGVAIAFKPFLLVAVPVFVVRRQWKSVESCVLTISLSCALSVLLFGQTTFADWLGNLRVVPDPVFATHFLNASWVALVSRANGRYLGGLILSAVTIMVMLWRVRTSDEDESWMLLLLAAILASPVGWVYYQPIFVGPAVALALGGRLKHLRWVALTCVIPALGKNLFQHGPMIIALTIGSVYFWGLLTVFIEGARQPEYAVRPVVPNLLEAT